MTRLILFLIRRRLHLKKNEHFRFANQKSSEDEYWFTGTKLMKLHHDTYHHTCYVRQANVKLNYIVSDRCKIVKVGDA